MFPLVLAALVLLAGCGGDDKKGDPIPKAQADRMIALLDLADRQVSEGKCGGAEAKAREVESIIAGLPRSVDPDVRQGLRDGVERLRALIQRDCKRPQPATDTTPTETTPAPTTETQPTTTTETTPAPTTETQPTTTTETTPTDTTPTVPTTPGNGGTQPPAGAGAGTGGAGE